MRYAFLFSAVFTAFLESSFAETDSENDVQFMFETLYKRMEAKDETIEKLVTKVGFLEIELKEMAAFVKTANPSVNKVEELEHEVKQLQETVKQQSQELNFLREKLSEQISTSTEDMSHDQRTNGRPGEKPRDDSKAHVPIHQHGSQQAHVRKGRHAEEDLIAFFAALTPYNTQHLGVDQNIAFDDVITNVGNAYNGRQGIFVAPFAGTYLFSATLLSHLSHDTHFYFAKNGAMVSRLYVDGLSSSTFDTSSQTIILQLAKGDDVSVKNQDADENIAGNYYTTFCGFLLQQSLDEVSVVGK